MKKDFKTTIGGQAVLEGIMMKGVEKSSLAIRKPDSSVYLETWENKAGKWYNKAPFIRGIFNFVGQLAMGYKCLMKSAEISTEGIEEENPSKFDKWLEEKFGDKLVQAVGVISMVLGLGLAMLLFMYLPALLTSLVKGFMPAWSLSLIEGIIKICIFVGYMAATSLMKDMKRLYQYHGAEHKTIACYEAGEELTVENVRGHCRFHPRCGTSFIFLVLFLGIIIFSVVTWSSPLIRALLKLALMPVVVSIAYEIIRIAGRHDNALTRAISWPGLKIQNLTTKEPEDDQIEIAITAMKEVLPKVEGEDEW